MNRLVCYVMILFAGAFQQVAVADSLQRDTAFIVVDGKQCGVQESIGIISRMLESGDNKQKLQGLDYADYFGDQLRGTDVAAKIIGMFDLEGNTLVKEMILHTLDSIGDDRSIDVFKKAAKSQTVEIRILGLLGYTSLKGPAVFSLLVEAMFQTDNEQLINAVIVDKWRLLRGGYELPPIEAWTSDAIRKKYLQEFRAWWQQNEHRLSAEWKTQHASDAKIAPQRGNDTRAPSATTPQAASALPHAAVKKMERAERKVEELSARDSRLGDTVVKVIAFVAAGLAVLSYLLWLILKKRK